jgi:hypothetical protein
MSFSDRGLPKWLFTSCIDGSDMPRAISIRRWSGYPILRPTRRYRPRLKARAQRDKSFGL